MRTTIELSDMLFQRAKLVAVQRKTTLKELISTALQHELDGERSVTQRMTAPPITLQTTPSAPALSNAEIAALMEDEDLAKVRL